MLAEKSQLDFELEFFGELVVAQPDFCDALRAHAINLAAKGEHEESVRACQKLAQLRPHDPDAHYNLACQYAAVRQPDMALSTLRTAIQNGFRDFRLLLQDRQFESIRRDPRFRAMLREYAG